MSIRKEIKELFNEYHQHAGNIVRGQIDWDFVEADIMMDLGVDRIVEEMGSLEQFYVLFNSLIDAKLKNDAMWINLAKMQDEDIRIEGLRLEARRNG